MLECPLEDLNKLYPPYYVSSLKWVGISLLLGPRDVAVQFFVFILIAFSRDNYFIYAISSVVILLRLNVWREL